MPTLHLVVALVKETGSNFLFLNLWVVFLPIICFMYGLNYMFQHVLTSKFEPGKWRKNWKSWEMLGRSIQRFFQSLFISYEFKYSTCLFFWMSVTSSLFHGHHGQFIWQFDLRSVLTCHLWFEWTFQKTCESSGNHNFFLGNTIKI